MSKRLIELLNGFRSNLKFSNGLQIIFNRLFRRDAALAAYIWQNRFFFVSNSRLGDHISLQEIFAEKVYDPLLDRCEFPGRRIRYVNIGANIGAFDVKLVERGLEIESGLAVELNPLTYQRCLVNLQTNHLEHTRLLNVGVAGTDGFLDFEPSKITAGDNIYSTGHAASRTAMRVELMSLESLLKRHAPDGPRLDLLKLDCEGAEYPMIRLSPAAVLGRFRYVIVEFHVEPPGESVAAAYAKLREAGFKSLGGEPQRLPFVELFTRP